MAGLGGLSKDVCATWEKKCHVHLTAQKDSTVKILIELREHASEDA